MSRPFARPPYRHGSTSLALPDRLSISGFDLKFAQNKRLPGSGQVTYGSTSGKTVTDLDGTLRWADENLLLQSEDLTTTWGNGGGNTTITANAGVAPDGTTTADDVLHNDSVEDIRQAVTVLDSTVHTASVFVKQGSTGSHDWVHLLYRDDNAANGVELWFDISTGTKGTARALGTGTLIDSDFTDEGNGWYRIWVSGQIPSGQTDGAVRFVNTTADAVDTSEATNSVFWWGAQLNRGSAPHAYNATTTDAFYGPRFDHVYDGTSKWVSKGLRLEPVASTNICLQTRALDTGANWTAINSDIPSTNNASPNGDSDADEIAATATADQQVALHQSFTGLTAGHDTAVSAHVHLGTNAGFVQLAWDSNGGGSDGVFCNFNITTGAIGTVTAMTAGTATDAMAVEIGNGYWLFTTVGKIAAGTVGRLTIGIVDRIDAAKFEAADLADNDSIIVTDTQVEANVIASSSRMPATTAAVTRAAETATLTFADQSVGTFYLDALMENLPGADSIILSANDGGTSDSIDIMVSSANKLKATTTHSSDTDGSVEAVGTITAGTSFKAVLMFADDDIALSADGADSVTDNTAAIPLADALTTVDLATDGAGANGASVIIGRAFFVAGRIPNEQGEELAA